MRQVRIHQFCDWDWKRDDKEVESHDSISFTGPDGKPQRYDHCGAAKHSNPTWTDLLELAGDDEAEAPPLRRPMARASFHSGSEPSAGTYICPWCRETRRGRTGTIKHAVSFHKVELVEASHAIPPHAGDPVDCAVCGFLCADGTGYASHAKSAHGEDAWEKIKAGMAEAAERSPKAKARKA